MERVAAQLVIDPQRVEAALKEARAMLDKGGDKLVLDLTAVARLAARDLQALQELATAADHKDIRIVLLGAGSSVYKVLKLIKLTSRFGFAN